MVPTNMLSVPELAIIGGILVVILVMGPKKIPELAHSIGLAKKEFKEATTER